MIVFLLNNASVDLSTLLRQANITVWTSIQDVPVQTRNDFSFNALERVDAVILDIGQPSAELQFILAQAIVLRRPTLCLYTKGKEPQHIVQHLTQHHIPKTITLKAYTRVNIDCVIDKFLKSIDHSVQLEDTPKIKFTLRLTPGLEHYLAWLSDHKQINKADHIRNLIRTDADGNEDYQQVVH